MYHICLNISYEGTNYGGFQIQKNAPTIQGELEKALAVIYKRPLRIIGAGRTDAGVHARGQAAQYEAPLEIPASRLPAALNALLPPDIVVLKAVPVPPGFHVRYSAKRKIYSYTVDRAPYPQVMRRRFAYHFPGLLNKKLIGDAAGLLAGEHDFKAFQASGSSVRSTVRILYSVTLQDDPGERLLQFTFEGSGFLYRMIRMLVGSLLRVGQDKLDPSDITLALEGHCPEAAGPTAPPHGLCLENIIY